MINEFEALRKYERRIFALSVFGSAAKVAAILFIGLLLTKALGLI